MVVYTTMRTTCVERHFSVGNLLVRHRDDLVDWPRAITVIIDMIWWNGLAP